MPGWRILLVVLFLILRRRKHANIAILVSEFFFRCPSIWCRLSGDGATGYRGWRVGSPITAIGVAVCAVGACSCFPSAIPAVGAIFAASGTRSALWLSAVTFTVELDAAVAPCQKLFSLMWLFSFGNHGRRFVLK
jgi:hypothetical protein